MSGLAHDLRAYPALLTPKEVAEILRLSVKRIYAMRYEGSLPGVLRLTGKSFRVKKSELVEWLEKKQAPAP